MDLPHLISIVGAGPGDPELLTVKALNRLKSADVILYDALSGEEILDFCNPETEKIYVGKLYKDGQNQEERQNEIHSAFIKFARENKKVVRLKAGDPMIFGRGAEEIRFCKENQLNFEVIPGITAGIAAASIFEIPLTEREKNGMALFYTGHRVDGKFSDLEAVISVLNAGAPVVIYMGLNNLVEFSNSLLKLGIDKSLPIQILSKVSLPEQKMYNTKLDDVQSFLTTGKPETPAIVIIGKYAGKI
ncbi:MAG: uroporphyrinogen-III C-methyltransferase [Prolixibacteraceae bacterium]|nr:uroporphyrinogen-III C-methyltransferase [Prolixibacteraceae bacterium]